MSVSSLLRSATRLESKNVVTHFVQLRALSGADAINALRPFYFAVHPDFFGQHPREREVNENSLKRLNGYLETLQKPGTRSVQPTHLTFYVRETKSSEGVEQDPLPSGFRSVSFTLHSRDVLSTVVDVLRSCSLPVEHVREPVSGEGGGVAMTAPFYRPIKWDKTYYSFTGFRDPEEELQWAKKVAPSLSLWLRDKETEATKKHNASLPRRDELDRLKKELCNKLSLSGIRWQRSWGVTHRCCQLQSLSRLSLQSPEALLNLQGHTIVFTDQSGMNASGHVMLGTTDVHHQWTKLFQRLPSYSVLQQRAVWLKERISQLLGGAQVIHVEHLGPVQPIAEHYSSLSIFHGELVAGRLRLHPRSLQGLAVTLESDRSSPSLHEMGHFILPTNCDPRTLQLFLQSHALQARERIRRSNQLQTEEAAAVEACLRGLSLGALSKEPSVSADQMLSCCLRLLELSPRPAQLQGLHLCVSHFYSVMQDGDLCVPWDWKS